MIQGGVFPCFDTSSSSNDGLLEAQSMRSIHLSLLVLKEKISQVDSFLNIFVTQEMNNSFHAQPIVDELTSSMAFSSMANLVQEIVQTASVMMLSCEQMALRLMTQTTHENNGLTNYNNVQGIDKGNDQEIPIILEGNSSYNWPLHDDTPYNNIAREEIPLGATTTATSSSTTTTPTIIDGTGNEGGLEVVELDAAELLARYTHYCQVCGRGFKREANLRMHMKAHGDKYKSSTLMVNNNNTRYKKLSINTSDQKTAPKKYSCPQEGCRWNKNHVKFQPLKSIVCVKNHYKRSHCPKMFMCKRCNTKEYSVLSDLKTHEKHCGEIKWYCSCGTSFSKKDKLMDHVALFVGHIPLITSNNNSYHTYQFE